MTIHQFPTRKKRSGRLFQWLYWLAPLALLGIACYLQDPHMLPARPWGLWLTVALAALLMLRVRRLSGLARALWLGLCIGAISVALTQETQFRIAKHWVVSGALPQARPLAPHFIVGYRDLEAVRALAADGMVGGVFITRRNIEGKSFDEIRDEIASLQAVRRTHGLPPLIIATDQEGGPVARLSPPLPQEPALASLLEAPDAQLDVLAYGYGERQGRALASLGVTVNFSPVVDLKTELAPGPLDTHTQIATRAISGDPQLTARVALAYGRGLLHAGVRPTLKHFPGLGSVHGDTHHFSAALNVAPEVLAARDWKPFREVSQSLDSLIMLGHVTLPALDAEMPASLSKAVVQGVIRDGWHHEGVLITDDLSMAAAYDHGLCNAVVSSLNAGVDLLLISYDDEKIYPALDCAVRALRDGRLDRAALARSDARLARMAAAH